jgi:epoxyqueuosine reductase
VADIEDGRIIADWLREEAPAVGFDAVGIAPAAMAERDRARLHAFVENGEHGGMDWMEETLARRESPQALWPEARSVIALGLNYGPDEDPMALLARRERANISAYARNRDYHDLIKKRLKRLARALVTRWGGDVKVFVDTAPVMEKPLAAQAGIGWQGKHTNLVSRRYGSWLFLGEIYTTLEIPPDAAHEDRCGSCRRCLDICPTNAFPAPYTLDARRCLSYLTIEHKGPIPAEFREALGNRIYGCDDCLAVCPWNRFATPTQEPWFQARDIVRDATLADFLAYDEARFRADFSGSPIKRIGHARFIRNVLIAAGNSGLTALAVPVESWLQASDPVLRGAAVWALRRLDPDRAARVRSRLGAAETDPQVLAEWTA